ncbi:MAG: sugar transferase [Anaerolineaceae bacterium]|nr:sugar transferase [Anaerolineaceae bacterium]
MFRRFSVNFAVFSIFVDMVLVDMALLASAWARVPLSSLSFVAPINDPVTLPPILFVLFPLVWVGVLMLFAVYDGRKNLRVVDELGSLTLGAVLAAIALAGILYFSYREVSRFLFVMAAALAYIFLVGWRLVARMMFRRQGLHGEIRRVLIAGAGTVGRKLEQQIRHMPDMGLEMVGLLDDDWKKQADHADILGSLDVGRTVIRERKVDDVIIALPRSAHERLSWLVSELHDQPVRVWVIPDYFSLTLHRARVDEFAGIPMLDLRAPALDEYQRLTKRAFDVAVGLLCMPVVLPLIGAAALAIWLEDRGSVFYHAARMGENGRLFKMHKFRTMVPDAEKLQYLVEKKDTSGKVVYKRPDDPRITRVGRVLRRTSLDELPQLFNVLKGEMSLVGPRPEIPGLVEKYELWQRKRFAVPQGMTGWWQVNGRSDKPMHLHTEEDLYYVQNYSIWLDLQILVKTVWVVLRRKGAY